MANEGARAFARTPLLYRRGSAPAIRLSADRGEAKVTRDPVQMAKGFAVAHLLRGALCGERRCGEKND